MCTTEKHTTEIPAGAKDPVYIIFGYVMLYFFNSYYICWDLATFSEGCFKGIEAFIAI